MIDPADTKGLKNRYIDIAQKSALEKELDVSYKDKILDFGCGVGRISTWIADLGTKVIGIDSSLEMIDVAKSHNLRSNLEFKCCDSSKIPYKDNSFNKIISVMVMQHILDPHELRDSIRELKRVLDPNGKIFLIEHVMRRTTSQRYCGNFYKILRSPEEYKDIFETEGFRLIKGKPITYGIFYKAITLNILPSFVMPLVPLFVCMDTILTRGKGVPKIGYINYLFVFEKEED
jgi:SAM-dependent methyltransferase